jgi:hypothetical protein
MTNRVSMQIPPPSSLVEGLVKSLVSCEQNQVSISDPTQWPLLPTHILHCVLSPMNLFPWWGTLRFQINSSLSRDYTYVGAYAWHPTLFGSATIKGDTGAFRKWLQRIRKVWIIIYVSDSTGVWAQASCLLGISNSASPKKGLCFYNYMIWILYIYVICDFIH